MSEAQHLHFVGWVSDLARHHTRSLVATARSEGLGADDALDAVQEAFDTFLGLPQARSLVGEVGDSRALLQVVVRNAARNMRRRAFRSRPHDEVMNVPLADASPSVDELLAQAEAHVQLQGCVSRLGEVQKRIVRLRMLEELSAEEVAGELGLTQGHVHVLFYRAKKNLLECMVSVDTAGASPP